MANFTKKAIINTLMELLDQMPLSRVTVKKIVDTSEINHNTFYYYFSGGYAVLNEIFEDEPRKLQEVTFSSGSLGDTCTYELGFINTHQKMILSISNSVSRDKRHLMKVIDKIMNDFSDQFLKNPEEPATVQFLLRSEEIKTGEEEETEESGAAKTSVRFWGKAAVCEDMGRHHQPFRKMTHEHI